MKSAAFFTLLCVPYAMLCAAQSLPDTARPPKIEVHLSIPKRTYKVGEPLELTAAIKNVGSEPFYVWNGVSFLYYGEGIFTPHLIDSTGKDVPARTQFGAHRYVADQSDFAECVEKEWLVLAPGQFYGMTAANWFSGGLKAGRYSLLIEYSSTAFPWLFAGQTMDDLRKSATRLKYPAVLGQFASNKVSFEVVK